MGIETGTAGHLIVAAMSLFWIGMLGLLWRRSLVGMLVGLLIAWVSVTTGAIGFLFLRNENSDAGAALVLCLSVLGSLQVSVGLAIVVARIKRRGTLDADDAGLLEG